MMKKLMALVLIVSILLSVITVGAATTILYGDANGDGKINNRDIGLLQQYVNDWDVQLGPTGTTTFPNAADLVNPDDPIECGGALSFDVEIPAGKMVLYHIYRVSGTTLHIDDATAYVVYDGVVYTPNGDGDIEIPVTSDSPNNPIVLKIGNSGKANKEYAVNFSFPEGSLMNPYDLKAGTIKTKIAANNDQGVYYSCIAEKDGYVTIVLKSVTAGVQCDIRVTVTDSSFIPVQHLLSETEDGKTLTVEVYASDEIEINFVALPDENFKYPAATIESIVSFS